MEKAWGVGEVLCTPSASLQNKKGNDTCGSMAGDMVICKKYESDLELGLREEILGCVRWQNHKYIPHSLL